MKVRTTIAGTALRARLTALCWGALTLLAPVAVSACSGSSSTPTVPTFTPSVTISGTVHRARFRRHHPLLRRHGDLTPPPARPA